MSPLNGGAERVRTDDLLNANQPLFQLSYGPFYSVRIVQTPPGVSSLVLPHASFLRLLKNLSLSTPKSTKYDRVSTFILILTPFILLRITVRIAP